VFISESTVTPLGALPRAKRFNVVGIFEAGAQEYDLGMALVHLGDAQRLGRMGEGVTGVRLKLVDLWDAWPVARDLSDRMEGFYRVRDWMRDNANFFRALKMEKTVMFILLSLGDRHRRLQPGVVPDHAGPGQAVRHRHPAHAGQCRRAR